MSPLLTTLKVELDAIIESNCLAVKSIRQVSLVTMLVKNALSTVTVLPLCTVIVLV